MKTKNKKRKEQNGRNIEEHEIIGKTMDKFLGLVHMIRIALKLGTTNTTILGSSSLQHFDSL